MFKYTLFVISLVALFGFKGFEHSNQNISNEINGVWADSNSSNFQNCTAIFSVKGNKLTVLHYLEFQGTPMVEQGFGTFKNNVADYKVEVTKQIPGWATKGRHVLTLSKDGKTLRGVYYDAKGKTGPLVFKKVR